jgi:GTP diphosphokinase / guanosine-3',5'-bis(diphosphate) 3'-diphosphatase
LNTQNIPSDIPLLLTHEDFPNSLRHLLDSLSESAVKLVKEAYRISVEAHKKQQRKSGHAYISHVRSTVAGMHTLAPQRDIKLRSDDIIVALLHDALEDHPQYFDEIYNKFGYDITFRVLSLSKPSKGLFEKWKKIIPQNNKNEIQKGSIYQLWQE